MSADVFRKTCTNCGYSRVTAEGKRSYASMIRCELAPETAAELFPMRHHSGAGKCGQYSQ